MSRDEVLTDVQICHTLGPDWGRAAVDEEGAVVSVTPDAPHDELVCALWRDEQGPCASSAVVSVVDRSGDAVWGCEAHAAQALDALVGDRSNQIGDGEAARRLLSLRWNHRDKTDG